MKNPYTFAYTLSDDLHFRNYFCEKFYTSVFYSLSCQCFCWEKGSNQNDTIRKKGKPAHIKKTKIAKLKTVKQKTVKTKTVKQKQQKVKTAKTPREKKSKQHRTKMKITGKSVTHRDDRMLD